MNDSAGDWLGLLKGVSRSFYLSLRLLPKSMRDSAGLAYLVARATDTVADTVEVRMEHRRELLSRIRRQLSSGSSLDVGFSEFCGSAALEAEKELLARLPEIWDSCRSRPREEFTLIREVADTILSGQQWDLDRFANACAGKVVSLHDDGELDDYTYRVAGCVGEFWTKLGFVAMGEGFSEIGQETLCQWGRDYGMGLQLVNILRDLPVDLRAGRCYLPVSDPNHQPDLLAAHRRWLSKARARMESGFRYADAMSSVRLRLASGLPAEIAAKTLEKMHEAEWSTLENRVKIPRRQVYGILLRRLLGLTG